MVRLKHKCNMRTCQNMGIWDGGTALYLSEEMFHRIPKINQEWWHIPLKPAFGRQGQAN